MKCSAVVPDTRGAGWGHRHAWRVPIFEARGTRWVTEDRGRLYQGYATAQAAARRLADQNRVDFCFPNARAGGRVFDDVGRLMGAVDEDVKFERAAGSPWFSGQVGRIWGTRLVQDAQPMARYRQFADRLKPKKKRRK